MGGHLFGLDLVVKLHGVGKTFLYLNVSVSMVDGALLLFESDGRLFIMICFQFSWLWWMQVVYDLFLILSSGCFGWYDNWKSCRCRYHHWLSFFGSTIRSAEPAK